jgi:amidase
VAAGLVPVAHAGDGGGSIRIPSSECGLVGLKPSRGRHSLGPELGEAWGGNVARNLLARSVRDVAAALDIITGYHPGDPYTAPTPACPYLDEVGVDPGSLRIGWTTQSGDANVVTHPECARAVQATADLLESLGHRVEEAAPAVWRDEAASNEYVAHFVTAYAVWTARELDHLGELSGVPVTPETVEPMTWAVAEMGRAATAVAYHAAMDAFHAMTRRMAEFWSVDGFDLLLTPTIPEPPLELGQFASSAENPLAPLFRASAVVPFVAPFNTTGQPAISLPLHQTPAHGDFSAHLPIGVQLVGAYAREDVLLRVAAQLEGAAPWAARRPPVSA